jgi:hypothetical protein
VAVVLRHVTSACKESLYGDILIEVVPVQSFARIAYAALRPFGRGGVEQARKPGERYP